MNPNHNEPGRKIIEDAAREFVTSGEKAKCLLCSRPLQISKRAYLMRNRYPRVVFICTRGTGCRPDFQVLPFLPYEQDLPGFYRANRRRHPQVGTQGAKSNALKMYEGFLISQGWNPVWDEFREAVVLASANIDAFIQKEHDQ